MVPTVGDSAHLHDKALDTALDFYRRRLVQPPRPFRQLPRKLVARAYGISSQNWHRLEIIDDRTILVHNHPVW